MLPPNNEEQGKPTYAREVIKMRIQDEMRVSYTRYAMSVIVGRALPDVRDGLKPVHRRILYAMYDQNMTPDRRREKCASAVGEVLKKYHPHGDQSVYDALVRMAQDFSMRHKLVDGQGNFGSIDGDAAAAYRYTEARLAPLAMELMRDIEAETVDFGPNFSESTTEPTVMPAVYPNLLVNGSAGIAVGMATNIPPHNLGEVCDAVSLIIDNPDVSVDQILEVCPGPDFPTSGLILGKKGIRSAFATGRGSVIMQARATIEPMDGGRNSILITELPYQVNKAVLIQNIAALAREKRIDGLTDVRDESDRQGLRIVIEMRRDTNPSVVLNFLYKHTALRTSFGVNMLAIVDGQPKQLAFKQILEYFITHREEVIVRRSAFQLRKAEARAHILEGFRAILASIDDVIALIRASQSREDARNKLINVGVPAYVDGVKNGEMVFLSEIQANAVLDMRLGQLTQLDRMKIDDEYADLIKEIERLRGILESNAKVRAIIKNDMARIKKEYANPRRTQIIDKEAQELKPEDLIAEEDVVVTITRGGFIKKLPKDTYRVQGRGGRGIVGLTKKEEDDVEHLFVCTTHNILLVFTNRGRVFQLKTYDIPTASRTSKGTSIRNLLQVEQGEAVTAVLNITNFAEGRYLFMVTRDGTVKKTALKDYATRLQKGIIAINLEGSDELKFVFQTDGKKEIILASRQGMSVRFNESNVRPTGRNSIGVTGMRFKENNDYIVGALAASSDEHVLTVSEMGLGKRSLVEDYRLTKRGGTGVLTLKVTEKTGELVSLQSVQEDDELMIISAKGIVIRQKINTIRETGRVAQGVKLINLGEGDRVRAVAKILHDAEEDELAEDATESGESESNTDAVLVTQPQLELE
jgi:DNA gyrase subunit A